MRTLREIFTIALCLVSGVAQAQYVSKEKKIL